jgi:hypothetical protein
MWKFISARSSLEEISFNVLRALVNSVRFGIDRVGIEIFW